MTALRRSPTPVSRRARRSLVLGAYLGYLGLVLSWSFVPHPWRWYLVVPLALLALLSLARLLTPQRLGVSDGPDDALDERQQAQRNRAYLHAYRLLGTLVVLGGVYAMLARDINRERGGHWWLPESYLEVQAVFWGLWLVALTLPTAITAWTEPDVEG